MFKLASVSLHEVAFVPHTSEVCSVLKACRVWILHPECDATCSFIYFILKCYLQPEPRSKMCGLLTCGGSSAGPFQPVQILGMCCSETMVKEQWHHQVSCRVHLPVTRSTPMCVICIFKCFQLVWMCCSWLQFRCPISFVDSLYKFQNFAVYNVSLSADEAVI
jgi:hypothetical protein